MKIKMVTFKTDDDVRITVTKSQRNKYLKIKKLCKKLELCNRIKANGNVIITDSDNSFLFGGNPFYVCNKLLNKYRQQKVVMSNAE